MPTSKDEDHRKIAAAFAEKWGVAPGDILWEGALHFKQWGTPPEFTWEYKEIQRHEDGSTRLDFDGPLWVNRRRPIPEEWIEEYEQEVAELYRNQ